FGRRRRHGRVRLDVGPRAASKRAAHQNGEQRARAAQRPGARRGHDPDSFQVAAKDNPGFPRRTHLFLSQNAVREGTDMGHERGGPLFLAPVAPTSAGAPLARANAAPDAGAGAVAAPSAPARAWKPLRAASASATSFLQNNWNRFEENYHPSYVL